ncbi:MAG: hypothetical protein K5905_14350 [Roseibium sp.]|uniref:DUF6058 family natural product biosynthesis protein n=1 Tax=Roseibium sp. TaxID=1936156 RepID=UPI00262835BD|nr:DUF6058 family natural product biosynthesis protein [Roseibium sp.]MCV0426646.1 hypothetical protein [Roseibium sp.]
MLLNYLYTNFLEEQEFAARCALSMAELGSLYACRVIPEPSYRYSANGCVKSFFEPHEDQTTYRFQLKGHVHWYNDITRLGITDEAAAKSYFATRYKTAKDTFLSGPLGSALCQSATTVDSMFNADHEIATWEHFLEGTFGVCTRDGLPETIFLKQAGVRFVEALISYPDFGNRPEDLHLLRQIVDLLDEVESDFAPHEVAQSSRQRCIIDIRDRFLRPNAATARQSLPSQSGFPAVSEALEI